MPDEARETTSEPKPREMVPAKRLRELTGELARADREVARLKAELEELQRKDPRDGAGEDAWKETTARMREELEERDRRFAELRRKTTRSEVQSFFGRAARSRLVADLAMRLLGDALTVGEDGSLTDTGKEALFAWRSANPELFHPSRGVRDHADPGQPRLPPISQVQYRAAMADKSMTATAKQELHARYVGQLMEERGLLPTEPDHAAIRDWLRDTHNPNLDERQRQAAHDARLAKLREGR